MGGLGPADSGVRGWVCGWEAGCCGRDWVRPGAGKRVSEGRWSSSVAGSPGSGPLRVASTRGSLLHRYGVVVV